MVQKCYEELQLQCEEHRPQDLEGFPGWKAVQPLWEISYSAYNRRNGSLLRKWTPTQVPSFMEGKILTGNSVDRDTSIDTGTSKTYEGLTLPTAVRTEGVQQTFPHFSRQSPGVLVPTSWELTYPYINHSLGKSNGTTFREKGCKIYTNKQK